jgi:hypothetical protein
LRAINWAMPSQQGVGRGEHGDVSAGGCLLDRRAVRPCGWPPMRTRPVRGQRVGEKVTQTPCDYWGYGGGFQFTGLNPDRDMTLRASAPGFEAQEKTFPVGLGSQRRIDFTLSRNR